MNQMYGADVSTRVTVEQWRAMMNSPQASLSYAIVRCYQSSGQVDPSAARTIVDAWSAGLDWVDVFHVPHFGPGPGTGHAKAQIDASVDALERARAKFGRYWIDVEWISWAKRTGWSSSQAQNVAFLRELIVAAEARGLSVGISTTASNWRGIMGDDASFASYPMWYAHWDGKPSFDDFDDPRYGLFGGWTRPFLKEYAENKSYKPAAGSAAAHLSGFCPEAAKGKRAFAAAASSAG